MRRALILLAPCALALSSCAALPAISAASSLIPTITAAGDKVVLEGTRAFTLAEYAYNSAATAVNETGKACLKAPSLPCPISATDAGRIRELNAQATQLLIYGKAARDDAARAVAARDLFAVASTLDDLRS